MVSFIEDHRDSFGIGPICRVLPIATATYYVRAAIMRDPELVSDRAKSDVIDCEDIERIFKASVTEPAKSDMPYDERGMILPIAQ